MRYSRQGKSLLRTYGYIKAFIKKVKLKCWDDIICIYLKFYIYFLKISLTTTIIVMNVQRLANKKNLIKVLEYSRKSHKNPKEPLGNKKTKQYK